MRQKRFRLAGQDTTVHGDPGDHYFQQAKSFGAQLEPLGRLMRSTLPPDAVAIDIGANIGLSTILMARACPAGHVFAFEPAPRTCAFLRQNLEANGIRNVTVIQAAVSDRPGELHFHENPDSSGSHVVNAEHLGGEGWTTVSVPAVALDAQVAQLSPRPVAFIKMDCEGHEPEALAGARALLARDRPMLFMEFNSWTLNAFGGHSPAAFAAALWRAFEVGRITKAGKVEPAAPEPLAFLHENLVLSGCVSDLVLRPLPGADLTGLLAASAAPAEGMPRLQQQVQIARLYAENAELRRTAAFRVGAAARWLARRLLRRRA